MAHQSELIAEDIHAYLKKQEEKGLLRFITCGSVDDGKSTLIGRLLWDSKMVFEDQLCALAADSKRVGTQGHDIDYALLLDGLQAEREQGITIDVAYRYYSTDKRKFIVADTPGHEQYTRNMVTGASTAHVAVILIDARKGVLTQTRRHSYLVSLVGIRHVVLAVNKMDLVEYSRSRFETICREYELFARELGFEDITAIPISALEGDNVLTPSARTPWYAGPTLMTYLETVQIEEADHDGPFRLPVQWVNRPDLDFRGYCGTISSGKIRPGDEIVVTSSGQTSRVERIVTMNGDLQEAVAGQAVTLTLADEIDISRGDLLARPQTCPRHTDRFEAKLVWLQDQPLQPERDYLLKTAADTVPARVRKLQHKVNVNSLRQEAGTTLTLNEVGICRIAVSKAIACDRYRNIRATGSFILIDRLTHATVAAGMIDRPLVQEELPDAPRPCGDRTGRRSAILWFGRHARTLGAEVPQLLRKKLGDRGEQVYLLDGLRVRAGLNGDLTAGPACNREHLRRLTETAVILAEAGLTVLVVDGTSGSRPLIDACAEETGVQWLEVCCDPGHQGDHCILLDTDSGSPVGPVGQILRNLSH